MDGTLVLKVCVLVAKGDLLSLHQWVMALREVEKTYRQTHGWFMRSNWLASGDDFAWLFCYILPSKDDDSGRE
nr:hypothetical protein Iba_chr12bCG1840 [Ipomoea batatas]